MSLIRRFIGVLLIIAAIGGLIFSILAITVIWRVQPTATENLQNSIKLLGATLATTAQGLEVTQEALEASVASIKALQNTVETTAKTIQSTEPIMNTIITMMADDLPETVRATQSSLHTAQQSAAAVDSVLGTLSSIPLLGGGIGYDPEIPLGKALGEVSSSLNDLPDHFVEISENLDDTSSNLLKFQVDLALMADSIQQIESGVAQYKGVIGGYQTSLKQVQVQLDQLIKSMPAIVNAVTWGLTIFLVWMAIAQLGLFTQGWELLTRQNLKQKILPQEGTTEEEENSK